jgi:hypothetical protein
MSAKKNISLFIPFVFPNFTQKYVTNAFSKIGNVERVDFVSKQDRAGKTYNAVYVHFKEWYNNELADHIYEKCFEKNSQTQFYHDDTEYFWIVLPNTAKKHVPGERKPRIGLGDANSINIKSIEKPDTTNLDEKFEEYLEVICEPTEELNERDEQMEEIETEMEAEMEEQDKNLISIDWRYVQAIEEENKWFHREIAQLRTALINLDRMYQVEAAKVRAFSLVGSSVDL